MRALSWARARVHNGDIRARTARTDLVSCHFCNRMLRSVRCLKLDDAVAL